MQISDIQLAAMYALDGLTLYAEGKNWYAAQLLSMPKEDADAI
jgi:hypothetical protein